MKRKQTKEMINACSVCFDERGWDENPLVYCDGANCNIAVHQACYGILSVPKGNWYCRKCESQDTSARCELCPFKGGALKQTDNGKWAHVVCALYIPEVKFANVTTMEPIVLSDIPKDRFSEICSICTKKGWLARSNVGACMRCNKANCKQQFHVSCAQRAGLLCEETGKNLNNIKYCGYCEDHSGKAKKNGTAAASGKRSQTYESPSSREDENPTEPAGSSTKQTQKKKHYGNNGKLYSTLKKDATSPHNLNLIISLSSNPPTVIESPSKVAEAAETDSKSRTVTGKGKKHKTSPRAAATNLDDATAAAIDVNIADSNKTDNDAAVPNSSDLPSDSSGAVNNNGDAAAVDVNSSSDDKGFCADARKKKSKHRKHFYSSSSSFKKHRFGRKKKYVNFEQSTSAAFDDSADDNTLAGNSKATTDQCSESGLQLANETAENSENEKSTVSSNVSSMNVENIGDDSCAGTIIDEGLLVKAEVLSSDEAATKKQSAGDGRKADAVKSAKTVPSRYNRVLEELLEKQWEQAGAFLMEQAGHYRVSDLLNELHQVRAEIIREEENQKALLMRRNHLLAVNARLSISNMMPEYTNFVANRDLQTDTEQTLLTGLPISSQVSFQQTKIHSPSSLQDASQKNFDSK